MLRRLLVLLSLLFWQGGFTFYSAVVVPIGSDILGSHEEQGWITRSVTNYLNIAGGVTLALWAWDIARTRDSATWRRRLRWLLWTAAVVALALLVYLHPQLDDYLDLEARRITSRSDFRFLHVCYLNTSTAQWVSSLLLAALTLAAWRSEDRAPKESATFSDKSVDTVSISR